MKKNVTARLLALLIALFFWVQQGLLREQQEIVKLPVQFKNIPTELLVIEPVNPYLPIFFKGRGLNFLLLKMKNAHIEIDTENYGFGRTEYDITNNDLVNLDRLEMIPEKSEFKGLNYVLLDRTIEKNKKIELIYQHSKDKDYFYKYKDLEMDLFVLLKGPQSIINDIKTIKTEPISQKMFDNGKLSLRLINPDKRLLFDTNIITLNLTQERLVSKTISLISITYPVDQQITIIPQKVSIMIKGPQNIVEKLEKKDIEAYLDSKDLRKIKPGKEVQLGVKFILPKGVKMLEYTPAKIQVIKNG